MLQRKNNHKSDAVKANRMLELLSKDINVTFLDSCSGKKSEIKSKLSSRGVRFN